MQKPTKIVVIKPGHNPASVKTFSSVPLGSFFIGRRKGYAEEILMYRPWGQQGCEYMEPIGGATWNSEPDTGRVQIEVLRILEKVTISYD